MLTGFGFLGHCLNRLCINLPDVKEMTNDTKIIVNIETTRGEVLAGVMLDKKMILELAKQINQYVKQKDYV